MYTQEQLSSFANEAIEYGNEQLSAVIRHLRNATQELERYQSDYAAGSSVIAQANTLSFVINNISQLQSGIRIDLLAKAMARLNLIDVLIEMQKAAHETP